MQWLKFLFFLLLFCLLLLSGILLWVAGIFPYFCTDEGSRCSTEHKNSDACAGSNCSTEHKNSDACAGSNCSTKQNNSGIRHKDASSDFTTETSKGTKSKNCSLNCMTASIVTYCCVLINISCKGCQLLNGTPCDVSDIIQGKANCSENDTGGCANSEMSQDRNSLNSSFSFRLDISVSISYTDMFCNVTVQRVADGPRERNFSLNYCHVSSAQNNRFLVKFSVDGCSVLNGTQLYFNDSSQGKDNCSLNTSSAGKNSKKSDDLDVWKSSCSIKIDNCNSWHVSMVSNPSIKLDEKQMHRSCHTKCCCPATAENNVFSVKFCLECCSLLSGTQCCFSSGRQEGKLHSRQCTDPSKNPNVSESQHMDDVSQGQATSSTQPPVHKNENLSYQNFTGTPTSKPEKNVAKTTSSIHTTSVTIVDNYTTLETVDNCTAPVTKVQRLNSTNIEEFLKLYNQYNEKYAKSLKMCSLSPEGMMKMLMHSTLQDKFLFSTSTFTVYFTRRPIKGTDAIPFSTNVSQPSQEGNCTESMSINDVSVDLPKEVLNQTSGSVIDNDLAICLILFNQTDMFKSKDMEIDNNLVIGIQVGNADIQNLTSPIRISFPLKNAQGNKANRSCRFWNTEGAGNEGTWSEAGCSVSTNGNQTVCECNHLTFFAVLLAVQKEPLPEHVLKSLIYISYIGSGISAIFSAITVIFYFSQRKSQVDDSTKIHINLTSALFLINMSFLMNVWLTTFKNDSLCILIALIMHYSLLCCLTWMGIEGFHLYLMLVKVFNTYVRWYMLKLCLIGWGIPAVVVTVVISLQRYDRLVIESQEANYNVTMCWMKNDDDAVYYITLHVYFAFIFLFNVVVFIIVAKKVIQMKRLGKGSDALKKACTLLAFGCLLGLTWGIIFLSFGALTITIYYIFTILNTPQGLLIFLWYCKRHSPLCTTRRHYDVNQDSVTSLALKKKKNSLYTTSESLSNAYIQTTNCASH